LAAGVDDAAGDVFDETAGVNIAAGVGVGMMSL
jgi:hypothetical protein